MKRFFRSIVFILCWSALLGGGYVFYEAHRFLTAAPSLTPEEKLFSIAPGATFDRVAWDLKKAGIITDVPRFRLLARFHEAFGKIRAGDYLLSTGWTPDQVLRQITQGQALLYRLSVREGLTWWETAKAIEEQGFASFEDFREVIHDPEFLRGHGIPFANAEGFLYPETYLLKKPPSPPDKRQAREVADIMVRMFWKKTEPLWRQLPVRQGTQGEPGGGAVPLLPPVPGAMSSLPGQSVVPPLAASALDAGVMPESEREEPGSREENRATALPLQADAPGSAGEDAARASEAVPAREPLSGTPFAEDPDARPAVPHADGVFRGDAVRVTLPDMPENAPAAAASGNATDPARIAGTRENATRPCPEGQEALPASPAQSVNATQPAGAAHEGRDVAQGPRNPFEIDPEALRRLVTLASLVEKETGVPEERGRVAGVYANRLRLKMLLQCDPTIIYGVGETFDGAIRRSQIDDPKNLYNTYQHSGLPPGPICSAGFASLMAAFAPEKHDFLYFVATGNDAGHTFSKTLQEHNRAVQIYRSRKSGGQNR